MKSQRTFLIAPLVAFALSLAFEGPASAQEDSGFRYLSTNFSITNVNIQKLLGRLAHVGVVIPFDLEGDASADLRFQIPINGLREIQAYRFDGTISSTKLKVADLEILNVQMDVAYRDGVLNLSPLEFQVPDTDREGLPPGTFRGTGRMELVPRGELSLNLTLDGVPARAVSGLISQPPPLTAGQLAGRVQAQVSAEDVGDIAAWNANGQFSATRLKAMDRELRTASFGFLVERGELSIRDLAATMDGADLVGTAQANLTGGTSYSANMALTVSDLSKVLPGTEVLKPADGLRATAVVSGTLSPLTYQVGGEGIFPETMIGPLTVDSGRLDYTVTKEAFAVSNLDLRLYRGAITGSAICRARVMNRAGWIWRSHPHSTSGCWRMISSAKTFLWLAASPEV